MCVANKLQGEKAHREVGESLIQRKKSLNVSKDEAYSKGYGYHALAYELLGNVRQIGERCGVNRQPAGREKSLHISIPTEG